MKAWSYRDRWGLVTGASAGLGEVFAHRLAERGMHLVLTARREDRLRSLADSLARRFSIRTAVVPADLSVRGEARRLWRESSAERRIDLLVNNAGFGQQGFFHDVPSEQHAAIVEVNCIALMELAHLAITDMRARRDGGIINVASIAGFQPVPRLATYAASKAFVMSLSEALWAENSPQGVRILALNPGRTPTEFQAIAGTGSAEGTFGVRTPEQVVDAGLRAFERGRASIVPGFENQLATWAARALPRNAVVRGMRRAVRKMWER